MRGRSVTTPRPLQDEYVGGCLRVTTAVYDILGIYTRVGTFFNQVLCWRVFIVCCLLLGLDVYGKDVKGGMWMRGIVMLSLLEKV